MRVAVLDKVGLRLPDHVGLAYDRWAPLDTATGKVPDDRKKEWLRNLAKIPISEHYKHAYDRWLDSLKTDETRCAEVEVSARLLVGHGNPSPTEVGLTVHHTWGVPVIPGSALKGLLSHYVDAVYGPVETGKHPMDPAFPEPERDRAPFRGVTWDGKRIEHGPGAIYRALFGAPAARSDEDFAELGAGETVGLVVFHDALFVAGSTSKPPFAVDVLAVHHKRYYDDKGRKGGPNDYDDPNPVPFLTVRPGAKFLVAVSGPSEWTQLAFCLLRDALVEWGVGGKTTSGYGHIRPEGWNAIWPVADTQGKSLHAAPSPEAPQPSAVVEELREWLSRPQPSQRDKLALLRADWLPQMQACTVAERQAMSKLIRKRIKNERLVAERDKLIAEMGVELGGGSDEPL